MKVRVEIGVAGRLLGVFEHGGPTIHIGRDPACELALDNNHEGVSWRHCRIDCTPGGFILEDLGSTNGTYVNVQRLQAPRRLQVGDAISLGQHGPQLRVAALDLSNAPHLRPDPAPPISALARPAGLLLPSSDPRPTLAGGLSPLRRETPAALAVRVLNLVSYRPWWWIVVGGTLLLVLAGAALLRQGL
jgi:predicted component of type VI protein secretion system